MTVAVSKAVEEGARAVIVASTGNTASSAAAYAARAGISAIVLLPEGTVASGKVAQSRMYGARVLQVRGTFDQALDAARELAQRGTYALVNSVNPYRREGQKTAVFEIVEELGAAPGAIYLPYGGGGNTTAYGQAFAELGGQPSRLIACEARDRAGTVATAIRITEPVHAQTAAAAIERHGRAARDPRRRRDSRRLGGPCAGGRALLRAVIRGRAGRARARAAGGG